MMIDNTSQTLQPVVYLVEDDLDLAQAMQLLFSTEGLQLLHFENGKAFLQDVKDPASAINQAPAACVLLDIRLGSVSGLEVFDLLHKQHSFSNRWLQCSLRFRHRLMLL